MNAFLARLSDPGPLLTVALIVLYLAVAVIISLASRHLARRLLGLRILVPGKRNMTPERQQTLVGLIGSLVTLLVFVLAFLSMLSLFVAADTLIWVVGLFSAAFGLGARSFVADVLAGGRFIFRNTFAIGEKVELSVGVATVEGTVEEVNVTNTQVRAPTGEVYVVPNGDITIIRNFSRAPYSTARLRFCVRSEQLLAARATLEALGQEAAAALPELTEPWQVISTADTLSNKMELTVLAHTPYGKAATLKLAMADLIYRRLHAADIELVD